MGAARGPARGAPRSRGGGRPAGPDSGDARQGRDDDLVSPGKRRSFLPGGIEIVYEDADLIVVDKPNGVLTVDLDGGERENVFDLLKRHVRERARERGTRVWVIHRLDKEASGLLVFTKSEGAFRWLKEDFKARRVHRLYAAVVEGVMERNAAAAASDAGDTGDTGGSAGERGAAPSGESVWGPRGRGVVQMPSGVIQSFLIEGSDGLMRTMPGATSGRAPVGSDDDNEVSGRGGGGGGGGGDGPRHAVTHWRVQEVGLGRMLMQVRLETGRKNQIRVHLKELGHPIVGDWRYGAKTDPISRVCLHAFELGFNHPSTGKPMKFRSPTPPSFFRLVGKKERGPGGQGGPGGGGAGPGANAADVRGATPSQRPGAAAEAARVKAPAEVAPATPRPPSDQAVDAAPRSAASALRSKSGGGEDVVVPSGVGGPDDAAAGKGDRRGSWDHVAAWYDQLIEERRSDHHDRVIVPGALRLLGDVSGRRVLDVACGQGVLCRAMSGLGARVVGVDASPRLIEAAKRMGGAAVEYHVGDARALGSAAPDAGAFDDATCVMALMNIEPLGDVLSGVAALLAPGGRFVAVVLHPAFRSPGQTSWGWEKSATGQHVEVSGSGGPRGFKAGDRRSKFGKISREQRRATIDVRQYRRVDGYLSLGQREIVMNPGAAAHGQPAVTTMTYHRPIQTYVRAFAQAGLLLDAMEEWPSMRASEPGPRAAEEDRARREIPMFLAIRAVRVTPGA